MDNVTITYHLEDSNPVLGLDEAQRALMEKLSTNENEHQYEWKMPSIVAYVVSCGSKEKARIHAKELRKLWVRYVYLGIIKPSVVGYDGNVAWTISDCNGSEDKMLTCLYDAIDGYFQTFTNEDDERNDNDPAYNRLERFRNAAIGSCKEEFDKYDLRNKIPMLKKLSDESYDLFCLELLKAKIGYAVALFHTVKIDEYTENFISKNENCTHKPIFTSYNEMYCMVSRIKNEEVSTIKGQFEVLRNPNNTHNAIRNNSPKYIDKAEKFYQSLKSY